LLVQPLVPRFDYELALTSRVESDDIIAVYMHEHIIGGSTVMVLGMVVVVCVITAVMAVVVVVRHAHEFVWRLETDGREKSKRVQLT